MRIYYFQCSHHSKKTLRGTNGRMVCPKCRNGYLLGIRIICQECGKDIGVLSPRCSTKKFCDECVRLRRLTQNKVSMIKYSNAKDAITALAVKKEPKRRYDCIFYQEDCLPNAAFSNKPMDCSGCVRYVKAPPLDVMDFVRCESPLAKASNTHPVYTQLGNGAKRGVKPLEIALRNSRL